jgi:hypothetical protein
MKAHRLLAALEKNNRPSIEALRKLYRTLAVDYGRKTRIMRAHDVLVLSIGQPAWLFENGPGNGLTLASLISNIITNRHTASGGSKKPKRS